MCLPNSRNLNYSRKSWREKVAETITEEYPRRMKLLWSGYTIYMLSVFLLRNQERLQRRFFGGKWCFKTHKLRRIKARRRRASCATFVLAAGRCQWKMLVAESAEWLDVHLLPPILASFDMKNTKRFRKMWAYVSVWHSLHPNGRGDGWDGGRGGGKNTGTQTLVLWGGPTPTWGIVKNKQCSLGTTGKLIFVVIIFALMRNNKHLPYKCNVNKFVIPHDDEIQKIDK